MFCAYCGESISVKAKFCPYCGQKTILGNPKLKYRAYNTNYLDFNKFYEGKDKTVVIGNKTIKVSKEQDCFNTYRRAFREQAAFNMENIVPNFNELMPDVVSIAENMNPFMFGVFESTFVNIALTLENCGVRGINANTLKTDFFNNEKLLYQGDLQELLDKYNEKLQKKHTMVKAVASVLPDGYLANSVGGFLAATALSYGAGKVVNSQLNSTNIKEADKNKLYEDCDFELWFDHIYEDLKNVVYYFFKLLLQKRVINYSPTSFIKNNRAEAIYNSIKGKSLSLDEWTGIFYEIISCNPYEEKYYHTYRSVLDKVGTNEMKEQFNDLLIYYVIDNVEEFI